MRTLGTIAIIIVVPIVGVLAWWASKTPTYVYRFRMTMEAQVDGALRLGSSVIQVRTTDYKVGSAETTGLRSQASGDAVFLDLGKGRFVFALLASQGGMFTDYPSHLVQRHFRQTSKANKDPLKFDDLQDSWVLQVDEMPTLITFSDAKDPNTARIVSPCDFEKEFGPNVQFNRVSIEMTKDAVTRGIENRLPWWKSAGRPAEAAYRALLQGNNIGPAIEPEQLFKRD